MKSTSVYIVLIATALAFGCKKSKKTDDPSNPATSNGDMKKEILSDVASNVIYASYTDLALKSDNLYSAIVTFSASGSTTDLNNARQAWKDVRTVYEQSEGFLFGPMSTANIDPRVDTWPINYVRLDSILSSSATFNATYVDNLEEALKGFHPIEYLLFGNGGSKAASSFTTREKDFLVALADNLKTLAHLVKSDWDPAINGNYSVVFTTAGNGSSIYPTIRSAYEEMLHAMSDICDEVANGKIAEPYTQHDPSLEESPFSANSIKDFTSNIKSVQNVYLGKYTTDGKGLEDLIKANNLSMDGAIKTKINYSLTALGNITDPFGQAISTQPVQVQNAMTTINDLKDYLDNTVLPYVQTLTN